MNKSEAIEQMKEGRKITHHLFSKNEWMSIENGRIVTEDGYKHNPFTYWS